MNQPLQRLLLPCLLLLPLFFLTTASSFGASILDIGTEYRLRPIALSNTDYGQSAGQSFDYYSERLLAHVGGRFSPNIEVMTQFQAIGVAGSSSGTIANPSINQAGNRYPNTSFTPWIQWAYLKASEIYDTPTDITVGRQPMMLGDGLILSDDDLGFTGIRMQNRLPIYDLQSDLFTFRPVDQLQGNANSNIYGLQLTEPFKNVRFQAAWVLERDASGTTPYLRPQENPATDPAILAGASTLASNITREFYDLRVESRLLQGGFYKGEVALQDGHVTRDPALGDVNLGGYAAIFQGGLFTHISKYGPVEVHGTFGQASGDSGSGTDDSFHPDFGHQYDGLERSGFGEFYGATLYNAFASSANPSGLPPGYSGIRVMGGGITTHPTALISVGIDYYYYSAMETPGSSFLVSSSDSHLGDEFDIGAGFAYTNYLTFRASAAFFAPGAAYQNQSQARRFLIEGIGRF